MLGAELAARLADAPLFRLHGEREPRSARQLATLFPEHALPYVAELERAVSGYTPLVADPVLAAAVGRLAGREVREATADLALRRETVRRATRLAEHRTKAVLPIALPEGEVAMPFESKHARGVVGVARTGSFELHLLVEGRPFDVVRRSEELPLHVITDLPAHRIGTGFAIPVHEVAQLIADAREVAVPLVVAIAKADAQPLADRGPARSLLARIVEAATLDADTRQELATRIPFQTIQDGRHVVSRSRRLAIASWDDDWLGPAAGERGDPLDGPIVHVSPDDHELRAILQALHGTPIDVQDAVARLQSRRRIARGLVPAPAVPHASTDVKRKLSELGELARDLGPGEIALVDLPSSSVLRHVDGRLHTQTTLDGVLPAVWIAIEVPELAAPRTPGIATPTVPLDIASLGAAEQLRALASTAVPAPVEPVLASVIRIAQAQALVARLVEQVLAAHPLEQLPPWVRRSLRRALLSRTLEAQLAKLPLFEAIDGSWLAWTALHAQLDQLGDLWTVPQVRPGMQPLDDRRRVIVLDAEELALARQHDLEVVDARGDLELDRRARANRDRPPATTLALPAGIPVLAQVTLEGDGITQPRGTIGVLPPTHADHRVLLAHRAMLPFGRSTMSATGRRSRSSTTRGSRRIACGRCRSATASPGTRSSPGSRRPANRRCSGSCAHPTTHSPRGRSAAGRWPASARCATGRSTRSAAPCGSRDRRGPRRSRSTRPEARRSTCRQETSGCAVRCTCTPSAIRCSGCPSCASRPNAMLSARPPGARSAGSRWRTSRLAWHLEHPTRCRRRMPGSRASGPRR